MTLNEYIIANAHQGSDERFLREYCSADLFFCIEGPVDQLKDGPLTASPDVEIRLQVAKLDIGRMAIFYASKGDARLSQRFAGMPLVRAAEMVCDMPEVDGMLIQSDGDAWLVARKDVLRNALGQMRVVPR